MCSTNLFIMERLLFNVQVLFNYAMHALTSRVINRLTCSRAFYKPIEYVINRFGYITPLRTIFIRLHYSLQRIKFPRKVVAYFRENIEILDYSYSDKLYYGFVIDFMDKHPVR